MESFHINVDKLQSYKDIDVVNLRKFDIFASILDIRVTPEIQFN